MYKPIWYDQVVKNLVGVTGADLSELENNIICAFEDAEIEGETEVIVNIRYLDGDCYINHADSPIINFIMSAALNEEGNAFKNYEIETAW